MSVSVYRYLTKEGTATQIDSVDEYSGADKAVDDNVSGLWINNSYK